MPARVDLASASSPAISTVVVSGPTVPAARVPAKVVLNALSTRELGSAAAISAAAELSAGTTRESKVSKFSGLVMSTTILPASCSPRWAMTSADGRVGDREDDDVAGHRGVDVVLAELLDGVAALGRDGGDGLAHVAGAEDGEVSSWGAPGRWISINRFDCCFK